MVIDATGNPIKPQIIPSIEIALLMEDINLYVGNKLIIAEMNEGIHTVTIELNSAHIMLKNCNKTFIM